MRYNLRSTLLTVETLRQGSTKRKRRENVMLKMITNYAVQVINPELDEEFVLVE